MGGTLMSDSDFTNDSVLEMYLFESTTLLEQLDEILLESEKSEELTDENIDEIFRIMHTIKGSSAMMDFDIISYVSHKLEDLFYVVREDGIQDDCFHELFDLVLNVSDFLKEEIAKVQNQQELSTENDKLVSEIETLLNHMKNENNDNENNSNENSNNNEENKEPKNTEIDLSSPETKEQEPSEDNIIYYLHVRFSPDCQMENIRAFMLVNKLETIGKILKTFPEELNSNQEASKIIADNGFYCSLSTDLTKDEINKITLGSLSVETCKFIDAFPNNVKTGVDTATVHKEEKQEPSKKETRNPSDSVSDSNSAKQSTRAIKRQNLINVDLNKLDTLMDLVGEIVITESMVSGSPDLIGLKLDNFNKSSHQLRKLMDELQDIVMSIRMIPIASTFHKMSRIVRDMSKKLTKDVELIIMGETTEVDKTIIDGIADPLMHLIRNSMDHGIEDRESRIAANKDPKGRIILSAQNVGGDIIICVSDDGKGIDPNTILQKAKEKDLLTKPESEMTEKEIFNLLTVPGFSTKEGITEFSGRGVGMDVVRKSVEKVGGTVTIESVKGTGTDIYFKIPLTLAIIASMEIKVGESIYTIPIANIRESFKASSDQLICDPDNNEMIMIRDICYPVVRLHKIFHVENSITKLEEGILLLVDSGDHLGCIFADELIGKHQVVVKPLPTYFNRCATKSRGIAGCTIMGDGNISLILDIPSILNQF